MNYGPPCIIIFRDKTSGYNFWWWRIKSRSQIGLRRETTRKIIIADVSQRILDWLLIRQYCCRFPQCRQDKPHIRHWQFKEIINSLLIPKIPEQVNYHIITKGFPIVQRAWQLSREVIRCYNVSYENNQHCSLSNCHVRLTLGFMYQPV